MTDEKNLLGIIGMCRGAGKAVIGTPMICEYLSKRMRGKCVSSVTETEVGLNTVPDILVIEASDTSENTHKRLTDKCLYYNVKHVRIRSTCEFLGKAVGKGTVAAVAVTDRNFCRAILGKLGE